MGVCSIKETGALNATKSINEPAMVAAISKIVMTGSITNVQFATKASESRMMIVLK